MFLIIEVDVFDDVLQNAKHRANDVKRPPQNPNRVVFDDSAKKLYGSGNILSNALLDVRYLDIMKGLSNIDLIWLWIEFQKGQRALDLDLSENVSIYTFPFLHLFNLEVILGATSSFLTSFFHVFLSSHLFSKYFFPLNSFPSISFL